jgi:ribonuclease III
MSDTVVIFKTHSEIEANLVKGLLDSHEIPALISSGLSRAIFPVPASDLGELRIAVPVEHAEDARKLIDSYQHSDDTGPRVVPIRDEFVTLETRLRYRFRDRGLLEHALTHRSRAHEDVTGGVVDNESLEFLGDAVLGFIIADALFQECPEMNEGQKSKIKASLVSTQTLAYIGERLELGPYLLLGRGEEKTGGRRKMALLADALEALIAAIYLDGGLESARTFVRRELWSMRSEVSHPGSGVVTTIAGDYKSALQEMLQAQDRGLPNYRVVAEQGPDHRKTFEVELSVAGATVARAEGRSKKEAEQQAAKLALERLSEGAGTS